MKRKSTLIHALSLSMMLAMSSCLQKKQLAEHSFGKMENENARASAASVISMGRDDEGGKALKWHIGGGDD